MERLPNGDAVVRDGLNVYRGRPIEPIVAADPARALHLVPVREEA